MLTSQEEALLNVVYQTYGKGLKRTNILVRALFEAIQDAFDNARSLTTIDSSFVHNLAACAVVALDYDRDFEIPWHDVMYDSILEKTVRGFFRSIVVAHHNNLIFFDTHEQAYYLNSFKLPATYMHILDVSAHNA